MTTRRIELHGVELVLEEAGLGGRPLLLLHGWTGAREDFTEWLEPLALQGWHAVSPDQRGHGEASKPTSEQDYSFEHFARDALALADALGWDRFTLLGHSMGGMVAQTLALLAPDRLDGLILMDTHHGPLDLDEAVVAAGVAAAREHGTEVIADVMAMSDEPGPLDTPAYRRLCAQRPGYRERGIDNTRRSSSAMFAAMLVEIASATCRLDALRSLDVPVLVLVGEQDAPFLDASQALADALPSARLAVLADGGHSPQFEAPEVWWDELSTFLGEVSVSLGE